MKRSTSDLRAVPTARLRTEWHHLAARTSLPLGPRMDLTAIERELLRRSWEAPPAEVDR